jgi:hypothetical protein
MESGYDRADQLEWMLKKRGATAITRRCLTTRSSGGREAKFLWFPEYLARPLIVSFGGLDLREGKDGNTESLVRYRKSSGMGP